MNDTQPFRQRSSGGRGRRLWQTRGLPVAAVVLLVVLACAVFLPTIATAERPVKSIAQGVTYEQISNPEGPWEIRVLRLQRGEPNWHLQASMGMGLVSDVERLSDIISRESRDDAPVVAAVNGDFFQMAHRPNPGALSGVMVRGWDLVTTPRGRPGFYILSDGTPRIEAAETRGTVVVGAHSWQVGSLNTPHQGMETELQIFSPSGGWTLTEGCLVVTLHEGPLRTQGTWTATVSEVVPAGQARQAGRDELLLTSLGEATRKALLDVSTGESASIELLTEPFTAPVVTALGGGPTLVRDGEIVAGDSPRHPRTAVGYNSHEILLVTVDGRQDGWSMGMTMVELARLMDDLGCIEALNLDGGGSTTMWVDGEMVNRPSDGGQRRIANALLVISTTSASGSSQ